MSGPLAAGQTTRAPSNAAEAKQSDLAALHVPSAASNEITITKRRLDELFPSPAQSEEAVKCIQRTQALLKNISESQDLLERNSFLKWKAYIERTGEQLNAIVSKGEGEEFLTKLRLFEKRLEVLSKYFDHDRAEGLIAVHAETGVRIYKRKGHIFLVTPDERSFRDFRTPESAESLKNFVKGITGVTINSATAVYQDKGIKDGHMLLGCRIDLLKLDNTPRYSLSTSLREAPESRSVATKNIRFTKAQLESGKIVADAEGGFGNGNNRALLAINVDTFVRNDAEHRASMEAAPKKDEGKSTIGNLASSTLGFVAENGSVPIPPDVWLRNATQRVLRPSVEAVRSAARRFTPLRRSPTAGPVPTVEPAVRPIVTTRPTVPSSAPGTGPAPAVPAPTAPTTTSPASGTGTSTSGPAPRTPTVAVPPTSGSGSATAPTTPSVESGILTRIRNRFPDVREVARRTGSNPTLRNTAYLTGLVGLHNAMAGDYNPEAEHSYMPRLASLLAGDLSDDTLLAFGVKTEFKTKETGAVTAWGMDVAATMGDVAIPYGSLKLAHGALNSKTGMAVLQRIGLAKVAAMPNWALRVGGRALSVAYAPIAGYSYTADGSFIHAEGNGTTYRAAIGAPLEGAIAGALVGGPFAPFTAAVGAIASTGTATYGAFSALGNVIGEHKLANQERGVRDTLERGQSGWLKGDSQPDNPLTDVARNYIQRVSKADFMQRVLEMKRQGKLGGDVPLYANNWKENWENIDAVIEEVRDYRNKKSYYFSAPLDHLTQQERDGLSAIYEYVFLAKEGTKQSAETLYKRSFLIETRDTSTATSWQAFWQTEQQGSKVLVRDEVTQLGETFSARFAEREKSLAAKDAQATETIEARKKLIAEEVKFLQEQFPLMIQVFSDVRSRNMFQSATTSSNSDGRRLGTSAVMTSSAVSEMLRMYKTQDSISAEMQELVKATKDPAFQKSVLRSLPEGADREILRRHFSAVLPTDVLPDTKLLPILQHAYEAMRANALAQKAK